MRITVLSDHAADQLQKREEERQMKYETEMQAYEGKLRARQDRIRRGERKPPDSLG